MDKLPGRRQVGGFGCDLRRPVLPRISIGHSPPRRPTFEYRVPTTHKLRPIKPFRIIAASGESYDVPHPEMMGQSPKGDVVIVMPKGNEVAMIDVANITEIAYAFGRKAKKPEA